MDASFNTVWKFVSDYMDELAVLLLGLGFFLTFFGGKYPTMSLFSAGFATAVLCSLVNINFVNDIGDSLWLYPS